MIRSLVERSFNFFTGEWMLTFKDNGGFVVLLRALWVATSVFIILICIRIQAGEFLIEGPEGRTPPEFFKLASAKFEWFGAIFAAVYLALYTRFASQWMYLANLYNQIKRAEVDIINEGKKPKRNQELMNWKAGFVADAYALHLAHKSLFKGVIENWLKGTKIIEVIGDLNDDKFLCRLAKDFECVKVEPKVKIR